MAATAGAHLAPSRKLQTVSGRFDRVEYTLLSAFCCASSDCGQRRAGGKDVTAARRLHAAQRPAAAQGTRKT